MRQTRQIAYQAAKETEDSTTQRKAESELDHNISDEERIAFQHQVEKDTTRQIRTPWMREGSDKPPVAEDGEPMTQGKLLTTPSRLLKLVLPLVTRDQSDDGRKDIEPLALLIHPQQPLSYLERLIQAELPTFKDHDGKERIPHIWFRAEDSAQDNLKAKEEAEADEFDDDELDASSDTTMINGKSVKTGKLTSDKVEDALRGGPGEGGVESYSGLGRKAPDDSDASSRSKSFVRWSSSTEIGDFIRDAARGKEFAVEIEGAPRDIRVGVPSFNDRTYYLRMRLRKTSQKIASLADIKKECDDIAHQSAKRFAIAGGCGLVGWWGTVTYLTFATSLGWDVMEPVTYLVGLSTIIGGYGWFVWHNREVSYRSAMHITVSRRQSQLYERKGFDVRRWEALIEEGNKLRAEIKAVADEYDVDWDELKDEKSEKVSRALKRNREKKKEKEDKEKEKDDDDD